MKPTVALLALLVWSWALVAAAEARFAARPPQTVYLPATVELEPEVMLADLMAEPTPLVDALVDWELLERETDCLWVILQAEFGYDITMERVTAAALWTRELGGACHLIGEDDE